MKYKSLIYCFIVALSTSCGPQILTKEEQAQIHLQKADSFFSIKELNGAKMQIDSINRLFSKQVSIRKKANTILYNIQLIEYKKNLIYADSVIKIKQVELDSILKNFTLEKDKTYQDIGNYIYNNQRTENKTGSTFIKAYVDENGILYLSSNYCSEVPIKHFSAKFAIGDVFAETEKVSDDGFNHSFKDEGKTFERVIYKNNTNRNIATLVQQNNGKTIVVTLQGEKRKSTFWLTFNEKKAISEAYNLSIILSDYKNLERIINISKKKIILLEKNIQTDKEE